MNQYLEKLAFTKSITNFVGNVSGRRAAANAERIRNIESFVSNNQLIVPNKAMKTLHGQQRVLERARDKARIKTGIATGATAGGIAAAGTFTYAKAKARQNAEESRQYANLFKSASLGAEMFSTGKTLASRAFKLGVQGSKALGQGVKDFALHVNGGKLADYGVSKGISDINSMGYKKFRQAANNGASADKLTGLVSRYGNKNTYSSLGQVTKDIKTLQTKKRLARIGVAAAGAYGVSKMLQPSQPQANQFYY